MGFTVFFCFSAGSVNEEMGFLVWLGEVEPSFKEVIASLTRIQFQVLRNFFLLPQ
jgi:hypothetical protein